MPLNKMTDTDSNTSSWRPGMTGISGRARRDPYVNANKPPMKEPQKPGRGGPRRHGMPPSGGISLRSHHVPFANSHFGTPWTPWGVHIVPPLAHFRILRHFV